jgi:two-component system sensor histidine kinase/response regulator
MPSRVLLVDDEPTNLALLDAYLSPLGYELAHARDGYSALASFQDARPDLVLLDYNMPGLDGLGVLSHIRGDQNGPYVPVILVTGHTDREHRVAGIRCGADDFLEKPIDSALLIPRVRTLLALKHSRDQLESSRDELQRRHLALLQAQREHRELMEFIVHDLKSPLCVVSGSLEWARSQTLPSQSDLSSTIDEAAQAAARITTMVEDLLTISRIEQSDFSLHREVVSVSPFLDVLVQSYTRRADEKGIVLAPPMDTGLEVRADRTLLQRVMENILENALRYTPNGGGHIAIAARPSNGVEISISNDGPPIPAPERTHIFERFRRGRDAGGARGNAGLGLYFCKRAIEAHGGAIDVVQTKDWPTSFLINLP